MKELDNTFRAGKFLCLAVQSQ